LRLSRDDPVRGLHFCVAHQRSSRPRVRVRAAVLERRASALDAKDLNLVIDAFLAQPCRPLVSGARNSGSLGRRGALIPARCGPERRCFHRDYRMRGERAGPPLPAHRPRRLPGRRHARRGSLRTCEEIADARHGGPDVSDPYGRRCMDWGHPARFFAPSGGRGSVSACQRGRSLPGRVPLRSSAAATTGSAAGRPGRWCWRASSSCGRRRRRRPRP
jgi:hypothetical protein